jgi:hypothetical protein
MCGFNKHMGINSFELEFVYNRRGVGPGLAPTPGSMVFYVTDTHCHSARGVNVKTHGFKYYNICFQPYIRAGGVLF